MRVLHATSDWKWTGPAEPMLALVRALRAEGVGADLACPEPPAGVGDGVARRARDAGIAPALALEDARGLRPLADRAEAARLRALLEARRYDVVHVHHARDHLLALRAMRGLRGPGRPLLVASWHRGEPIPRRPWTRWLYGPRRTDGLVVLSEALAARAARDLGRSPESVLALPGSVDLARFRPRGRSPEALRRIGIDPDATVLGVVARVQPHRRFDLLLDAFARARQRAPGLRLVVLGRGTRAVELFDRPVREAGLAEFAVRPGYRREDYAELLASFDALVFLVPGSDGSCRAVLEAMASGVPVIATRRGVLPELVEDGVTGRLVDESPEALAAAMAEVALRPAVWRERGAAARARAETRFRPEDRGRALARFYRALLERARADPTPRTERLDGGAGDRAAGRPPGVGAGGGAAQASAAAPRVWSSTSSR